MTARAWHVCDTVEAGAVFGATGMGVLCVVFFVANILVEQLDHCTVCTRQQVGTAAAAAFCRQAALAPHMRPLFPQSDAVFPQHSTVDHKQLLAPSRPGQLQTVNAPAMRLTAACTRHCRDTTLHTTAGCLPEPRPWHSARGGSLLLLPCMVPTDGPGW